MKQTVYLCLLIVTLISFKSCQSEHNNADTARLEVLDSLLALYPEAVIDSLKKINSEQLSTYNKAYYQLLDIIAKDKTYFDFSSDSIINSTVDAVSTYRSKQTQNYARSLMYQGIVRYRMKITDSTAYQPLREAVRVFHSLVPPDLKNQYLCLYYLGEIHDKNNNIDQSRNYYERAVQIAKQLGFRNYVFSSYRNLFWNRMKDADYFQSKSYLDSLDISNNQTLSQNYEKDNMYSSYYKSQGQYSNAIFIDKKMLYYDIKLNDSTSIIADLYRLSQNYKNLNHLDSAFYYGQLAIQFIRDTTSNLNYLYYLNIAEITKRMGSWEKSANAYKNAYELMSRDVDKNLDTKILELEKRYNLAEAENKRLAAENRSYLFLGLSAVLLLAIIIGLLFYRQYRIKMEVSKQIQEEQLNNQRNMLNRDAAEKQWVEKLYNYVAQQKNGMGELLYKLQNNIAINDNERVRELITATEKSYTTDMKKMSSQLLDDEMFLRFTKLTLEESVKLNESDKFLIMLIICRMSYKQIESLLGSSYDSIRIRKKRLLNKIVENNIDIPNIIMEEIEKW
jgi:hypothetical protein